MNLDLWVTYSVFMSGLYSIYQDIAKNLTKGQFAQNLKKESDIYEHEEYITHRNDGKKCKNIKSPYTSILTS